jgi:hypothetical protein
MPAYGVFSKALVELAFFEFVGERKKFFGGSSESSLSEHSWSCVLGRSFGAGLRHGSSP